MDWEFNFLDYIQNLRNDVLDNIVSKITMLGDGGIFWILVCILLLVIPKTRKSGIFVAIAIIADAMLCNLLLKPLVARIRPYDVNTAVTLLIRKPVDYSFPSGHTSVSFAVVSALTAAKEKRLFLPALIPAILIALSRLYLYVHYPTDVLGGIFIGILCGLISMTIYRFLDKKFNLTSKIQIKE